MKFNKNWQKYSLYDLAKWKNGIAFKSTIFSDNTGYPVIKIAELKNGITSQTNYTKKEFPKDVYLKYDDLIKLDRFKEKSAQNLIDAINNTKNNTLDKLIFGLGIRHIGKKAAKVLAQNFNDIYEIKNSNLEKISSLEDFGDIMAKSVVSFFAKEKTDVIIKKLEIAGVNLKGIKEEKLSNKLENKIVCITGSFDNYSRNDLVKLVEDNSGKFSSSVSSKTNILVAGENAGSKLKKAEQLGTEILTIDEFINLLK